MKVYHAFAILTTELFHHQKVSTKAHFRIKIRTYLASLLSWLVARAVIIIIM